MIDANDRDYLKRKLRVSLRRGTQEEEERHFGPSFFHRGDTVNYNPYQIDLTKEGFLRDYLFKGWVPDAPPIERGTRITAFGSCFAANITKHLSNIGFDVSNARDGEVYISRIADGLVNVHALAGQLEWALEDKRPPEGLWHGFDAAEYGFDEELRRRTRDIFLASEFFIVTLGLSEIWYDEPTGGVFWRAVPRRKYDPARHKFRVASFAETKEKIALMYSLIRRHVPGAKMLFTLSPVALSATFRPVSCLTANSASKAILRAALDEFIRDNANDLNTRLFYFPSYEFVNELFATRFRRDNRHPHDFIVAAIMKSFEATYCRSGYTLAQAEKMFQEVRLYSMRELHSLLPEAKVEDDAAPKPGMLGRVLSTIGIGRKDR